MPLRDRYAVVGNPVAHSLSPRIHGLFAQQTGQAMIYERLLAPLDGFRATVERFFREGGLGLNVTVPFKGEAAEWVSELDPAAAAAGAVNTIALAASAADPAGPASDSDHGFIRGEIRTRGFNTDGAGLVRDLQINHGQLLSGKRLLVLGAGGAVRGVLRPLLAERPALLTIANRTANKARELAATLNREGFAARMGVTVEGMGLDELDAGFDLVISGTSAGLAGERLALPPVVVRGAFCYDMIYGAQTEFCRWSAQHGARQVVDGLGMLVEQAALAFALWRGVAPETGPVLGLLRNERR